MLETWFAKTATVFRTSSARRWLGVLPPGVWIIIAVVAFVGGRFLWVQAGRPAHRQEITEAFGSVSLFYGVPQMNHDGSRIIYVATGDNGYGLFLCDTATGHKQIVFEENGLGERGGSFDMRVWPWSPDDSAFIYTAHDKLIISPVKEESGAAKPVVIDIPQVSEVVWLAPGEFVYCSNGRLGDARKLAGGKWITRSLPAKGGVSSLTAISTNTIAWLSGNLICQLGLNEPVTSTNSSLVVPAPVVTVSPLTNGLALWLDASTLSLADQMPVTALADLSGKKNDAIPNRNPPSYNSPTNSRALHGKGTIHFTSANSITNATGLKTGRCLGLTNTMPRSVFAVLRRDASRQMMAVNIGEAGGHGTYFGINDQADALYLPGGWDFLDNKAEPSSANWNLLEVVYDGTNQEGYVNGTFKGGATFHLNTVDKVVEIGLRTGRNAAGSDGNFAELLIYNRALAPDERRQVEDYLSRKWFGGKFKPDPSSPEWFDTQMDGLVGLSWSKASGQFLLRRTVKDHGSLWWFNPNVDGTNRMSPMSQSNSLHNVEWIGGENVVGLSRDPGHRGVVLADATGTEKKRWLEHADIQRFTVMPDRRQLLILGTITNELSAEIWLFDLDSGQVRPLVDCSDHPSPLARSITPFNASIKLPSGRSVNCVIYSPPHFDRHKKYPLLLGDTVLNDSIYRYQGSLWAPAMASCGAYVVIIERGSWFGGIEQWGGNVMGVYENLVRDPCIDLQQVYLIGASAETRFMGELITKTPGLWNGAIFLNPTALPDFSESPMFQSRPKILISAGSEEHEDDRFKKYQADALNYGAMVDFIIHPGEQHHLVGNAAQLERTKAMMHFIFEE
jgi:hypothetical protein